MESLVVGVLGAGIGSGIMAIVLACLKRKWTKEDRENSKLDAVVDAQKIVMLDRVRVLAKQYIADGCIPLEDKEHLHEMFQSYKRLGGNGHLDPIMKEVEKLRVVGE